MNAIDYDAASAEVKAIFDDIKQTRGVADVNNFWKYLANEPRMLVHVWSALKEMMAPGRARSAHQGADLCRHLHHQ